MNARSPASSRNGGLQKGAENVVTTGSEQKTTNRRRGVPRCRKQVRELMGAQRFLNLAADTRTDAVLRGCGGREDCSAGKLPVATMTGGESPTTDSEPSAPRLSGSS
jgi:hypothetical protein